MYNPFKNVKKIIQRIKMKKQYEIIEFKHKCLIGKPCYVSRSFVPEMERFCDYLEMFGLKFHVTSSYRLAKAILHGKVVDVARLSNHFIGHGIDGNIVLDGLYYTAEKFERLIEEDLVDERVEKFIAKIRADKTIRTGLDFPIIDAVHFDSGLNRRNTKLYKQILKSLIEKPKAK